MSDECSACQGGQEKNIKDMQELLSEYTNDKSNLIQILNEVQEKYGYVPKFAQLEISKYLNLPMAEIYGVITFYSRFSLEPKGKHRISVCLGTACFVKGSEKILERVKEKLGINAGQTTEDGKFSIDAIRCIGACGLAPVFLIDDDVHGRATVDVVDQVLEEYKNKE